MKASCLKPTDKNLLDTFENDYIGRKEDVINFVRLICAIEGGVSIALDAKWGEGKTFFIKQTQMMLDAHNDYGLDEAAHGLLDVDVAERLQGIFSKVYPDFRVPPFVTVYYDAWEHDNDEDPILSLVYCIINSGIVSLDSKRLKGVLKRLSSIVADIIDGVSKLPCTKSLRDIVNLINQKEELSEIDKLVSCIRENRDIKALINEFFIALLNEKEQGVIIFIDELDRCKPLFAVKLLERIKHYFSNDKIRFVFAINKEEIQHTIKCVYGEGYDGTRYLDRFFDYSISLPNYNKEKLYSYLMKDSTKRESALIKDISACFGLSIREIIKMKDICQVALSGLHGSKYRDSFVYEDYIKNSYLVIYLMVGLRMYSISDYNLLISGNGLQIFNDYVKGISELKNFYAEMFYGYRKEYEEKDFDAKLGNYYEIMFMSRNQYFEGQIGKINVSFRESEDIKKMVSLMSILCDLK